MGNTSRDLLRFEHGNPSTSALDSALLVCNQDSRSETPQFASDKKLVTAPVLKSQFLGKVKDFLGVISEANKRLELDAKENSQSCDIEALTGDESQVIEMDLMLGVADLNTPEAVAAAESAIAGKKLVIPLAASSSESESDSSDDDEDNNDSNKACSPKTRKDDSITESAKIYRSNKRPRIIELP